MCSAVLALAQGAVNHEGKHTAQQVGAVVDPLEDGDKLAHENENEQDCHGHQGQHVPAALIVVGAAVLVVEVGQAETVAVLAPQGRQTDAGDGTQEHGQGSI